MLVALAVLLMPRPAWAHDPGLSTAQGELRADGLVLTTGFAPADVEMLLPPTAPRAERWGPAEFEAVRDHLVVLAAQLWEIRSGGTLLPPSGLRVELLPGDNVSFQLRVVPPQGASALSLRAAKLAGLPSSHRQFVMIADQGGLMVAKKLLSTRDLSLEVPLVTTGRVAASSSASDSPGATEAADLPSAWAFLRLGMEHIWTGYDHLLFLFALLVVCRTFRSIVVIVTCFTLAHSLTLALATLQLVHLPARVVEPLIAATIVFVGLENLLSRGREPRGRWALTFGFGLIHGFGFASVLRDLGVGGGTGILMPLFTFNLGVEVGQVAIAALVLPLVWRLRKNETFLLRGVPALSAVVSAMGLYWLLQRTLF